MDDACLELARHRTTLCYNLLGLQLTTDVLIRMNRIMTTIVLVSLGAAVGANLRYWLSQWAAQQWGVAFPYGTLLINVLADAQTSGGLLISVPPHGVDWLCDALRQGGCRASAVVGRVFDRQTAAIVVR